MTTRFGLIGISLVLAACSSYQERPSPFADLEPADQAVAEPDPVPEFPVMECEADVPLADCETRVRLVLDGERIGTLTRAGAAWLADVDSVMRGNSDVAEGHTRALRAAHAERDAILNAAKAEYELAELRGRLLFEERQADIWGVLGGFGRCFFLGAIGGATQ